MKHRLSLALVLSLGAPAALAQPAPAPPCGPMASEVFAPGCDGPGVLVCDTGASLPAGSSWCGCDGRTHEAASMAPPSGLRYRFRGACEVPARFELTPERSARNTLTGRVVVFALVGNGIAEATREVGPCGTEPTQPGELSRLRCGSGARSTVLVLRQAGGAVVVTRSSSAGAELLRLEVPVGQRLLAGAPRRF
ncbi:MAG: hypothetical protein HY909_02915 [Deltaproteobacteria bacterium]|nr:hypothetical protein [Deltaproteobacteria bacterium]